MTEMQPVKICCCNPKMISIWDKAAAGADIGSLDGIVFEQHYEFLCFNAVNQSAGL